MTFNMQSATDGYSDIVSSRFRTLSKVPSWEHETHTRFAGDALEQITQNKILEKQLEGLWKRQGLDAQQGTDWPGLGMQVVSLAGGLGAFSGGGGFSYGKTPIGAGGGSVGGIGTLGPNYGFPSP